MDQLGADSQPQPGSTLAAPGTTVGLREGFEDDGLLLRRDPNAGVAHCEVKRSGDAGLHLDRDADRAALREFHGVAEKVQKNLAEAVDIARDHRRNVARAI